MVDPNLAILASKLSKAQREALAKWPDAWMAASEVLGLRIAGNVASVLADKGMLERRRDPNVRGRSQYRLSDIGRSLRDHLREEGEGRA